MRSPRWGIRCLKIFVKKWNLAPCLVSRLTRDRLPRLPAGMPSVGCPVLDAFVMEPKSPWQSLCLACV